MNDEKELAALARRQFVYNRETGELRWSMCLGNTARRRGKLAGTQGNRKRDPGRIQVSWHPPCNSRTHWHATWIIWLLVHGRLPAHDMVIDHINRNAGDNHLLNLREVTHVKNADNRRPMSNTGIQGISLGKGNGSYRACIEIRGERLRRYCKTMEQAKDVLAAWRLSRENHQPTYRR